MLFTSLSCIIYCMRGYGFIDLLMCVLIMSPYQVSLCFLLANHFSAALNFILILIPFTSSPFMLKTISESLAKSIIIHINVDFCLSSPIQPHKLLSEYQLMHHLTTPSISDRIRN